MLDHVPILLAEDDLNDLLLMQRALDRAGFLNPVLPVRDGREIVEYLEGRGEFSQRDKHPLPGLLLLDLKMPVMNGFEVLRWVRSQPKLKRLPIIILTGSVHETDTRTAYEEGANSYLIKPANFNELVETIKNVGDFWLTGTRLPNLGEA